MGKFWEFISCFFTAGLKCFLFQQLGQFKGFMVICNLQEVIQGKQGLMWYKQSIASYYPVSNVVIVMVKPKRFH